MSERDVFSKVALIGFLVIALFAAMAAQLFESVMPAYAADASSVRLAAASADGFGCDQASDTVTTMASGSKVTLENAKGTIDVYPYFIYNSFELYSSSSASDVPVIVKSGNTSICDVYVDSGCLTVDFVEAGKSTISYRWKGKLHNVTFVMHKWTTPAKSFKVGGKQFSKKFKKEFAIQRSVKFITGKVKVAAKTGWKVSKITGLNTNYKPKAIKNGRTTLKKKDKIKAVVVEFTNRKTGQTICLSMSCKGFVVDL